MAIDPTGRFPQLPVPLGQPRAAVGAVTPRANQATDASTVQNRGRPAKAELQADLISKDQARQTGADRPRPTGQALATPGPNAPRGSILDILV
jgi:hypothetical protein